MKLMIKQADKDFKMVLLVIINQDKPKKFIKIKVYEIKILELKKIHFPKLKNSLNRNAF